MPDIHWLHGWEWFVNLVNGNHPWIPGNAAWAALGAVAAYLVWPRVRRAVDGWMADHIKRGHADIHRKIDELQAKADHIILWHPDIPPLGTPHPDDEQVPPSASDKE